VKSKKIEDPNHGLQKRDNQSTGVRVKCLEKGGWVFSEKSLLRPKSRGNLTQREGVRNHHVVMPKKNEKGDMGKRWSRDRGVWRLKGGRE